MTQIFNKVDKVLKNVIFLFFLLIITGYILLPKAFSKLKVNIGPIPLYITEIFIFISIIVIIVLAIKNKFYFEKIYFFYLFLFFFAILFLALSKGLYNYRDVTFTLRQSALFYYGLFYFIIFYLFGVIKKINYFLTTILVCTNLLIIIFIIRYLGFEEKILGTFSELMIGGYYFPIALLLVLEINLIEIIKNKYLKALIYIDIFLLIILSVVENVRGNWIALFAAFIFSLIIAQNKKRFLINILIIIVLIAVLLGVLWFFMPQALGETLNEIKSLRYFFFKSGESPSIAAINTNWRVITWKGFIFEFFKRPFTGWGFGRKFLAEETFELGWNTGLADNWVSTHNYIISFLYMSGMIGLIAFMAIIINFFLKNIKFLKNSNNTKNKYYVRAFLSCIFYILILGLFEVVLEVPYQGVFFWVFFSFDMIILKQSNYKVLNNENILST
ncbi:hypothetical protein ES703_57372 [subsurface metagenome]